MSLPGAQSEELQAALLEAFNLGDLKRMANARLHIDLEDEIPTGSLREVVFELIKWAEREGRTEELIAAALAFKPSHPALRAYAESYAVPLPPAAPLEPSPSPSRRGPARWGLIFLSILALVLLVALIVYVVRPAVTPTVLPTDTPTAVSPATPTAVSTATPTAVPTATPTVTPVPTARRAAWLIIERVDAFGYPEGSEVRVIATVNGVEYVYPTLGGIEWLEIGPTMAAQSFRLPASADAYTIRFAAEVRTPGDESAAPSRLISVQEEVINVPADLPFEGTYGLHLLNDMSRAARVSAEVVYRVTYDP